MIQEVIVTTQNQQGHVHIAPMGVHVEAEHFIILPFQPSTTLDNILQSQCAVMNYSDDVRIFAGCLTGRRDWPTQAASQVKTARLQHCLAHNELQLLRVQEDETRPKLYCKSIHTENHAPFQGFNRAQYAVLEAAILVSRLHMLPWDKINSEIEYLKIGLEKTASARELEAWGWLMQAIEDFKQHQGQQQ